MPLKKRYTLSGDVIRHIFQGEISGNSFAGLHSEAEKSIDNSRIRLSSGWPPGQLERRNAGKSYWARISVQIDGTWYGPGMSSFFPKPGAGSRWTKANIILWIEQALTNPIDTDRSSREMWTSSPRQIRATGISGQPNLTRIRVNKILCFVQWQGGQIASIYPLVPGAGTA